MRILSEKEQLEDRIFQLDQLITSVGAISDKAFQKKLKLADSWFATNRKIRANQYDCEWSSNMLKTLNEYRRLLKEKKDALSVKIKLETIQPIYKGDDTKLVDNIAYIRGFIEKYESTRCGSEEFNINKHEIFDYLKELVN